MTTIGVPPAAMKTFRLLIYAALVATAVAVIALVWLTLVDPAEGTMLYDTLGPVAAFSGISAGVLFGAAAVWAQIKGLWEYAPRRVRIGATAAIVVVVAVGLYAGGRS